MVKLLEIIFQKKFTKENTQSGELNFYTLINYSPMPLLLNLL